MVTCFERKLDQKKSKDIPIQTRQMLYLLKIGSLQELYNVIFHIVKSSFKLNQVDMRNDWEVLLISQKIPNNYLLAAPYTI